MKAKQSSFPTLQQAFSGYLHEDLMAEHGSAAAAVRAFLDDASTAERARFWKEAGQFLAQTSDMKIEDLRAALGRLGSRWAPPSREALVALLTSRED